MGLKNHLKRLAVRRVHVLLADLPGHFETRVAAERFIAARGWVLALSPADADALLVIGTADSAAQQAVDHVYDELPGPRAHGVVEDVSAIAEALDRLREHLLDESAQHEDARGRRPTHQNHHDQANDAHDQGDHDQGDHDHEHMAPSGIPLAEGAEDRDGLEMDRTHLFLGPVLPRWPAGLVVRCTLHGDTVMDVEVLAAPPVTVESDHVRAARAVDAAVDVLVLAGADRAAERLRVLRDQCLQPGSDQTGLEEERGRLRRDRWLRWTLGDAHPSLLRLLDHAIADLAGAERDLQEPAPLADLVSGVDLATVRLRIAAAGPGLWSRLEVGQS